MAEYDLQRAFDRLAVDLLAVREIELLPLAAAHGRILADTLVSARDLPAQDVAAMDGYAVCAEDLALARNRLRVVGRILAGHAFSGRIARGTCARIMTGAPMPQGSDAVVVQEAVEAEEEGSILAPGPLPAGANRRLRGEHVRCGDAVLPGGRRLRAADLGMAAAIGVQNLGVYRRLRAGVLSTGDELRDAPQELFSGFSYDGNRPMLVAALAAASILPADMGICPDDPGALAGVIDSAFERRLDVLLTSGGAALGDADVVRALDGVEFVPVDFRPGRGIAVARLVRGGQGLLVLGLPGNAVAAYVLFHLLALPLLARMAGADARPPLALALPLAQDLHARPGRVDLRRARLVADGAGGRFVEALAEQGSAMIRSVCDADALVAVGPAAQYRAGDLLPTYLLETIELPMGRAS